MKAIWNGKTVASSNKTIVVENNHWQGLFHLNQSPYFMSLERASLLLQPRSRRPKKRKRSLVLSQPKRCRPQYQESRRFLERSTNHRLINNSNYCLKENPNSFIWIGIFELSIDFKIRAFVVILIRSYFWTLPNLSQNLILSKILVLTQCKNQSSYLSFSCSETK